MLESIDDVEISKGKYGAYFKYNNINYTIPHDINPAKLVDIETFKMLIELRELNNRRVEINKIIGVYKN